MSLWGRGITHRGWIGVDLDSTLAKYESGQWPAIGDPVPEMLQLVKALLAAGWEVRIMTARVGGMYKIGASTAEKEDAYRQRAKVQNWIQEHVGTLLPVTAVKDYDMALLLDDRAVTVEHNTGRILTPGWERLI